MVHGGSHSVSCVRSVPTTLGEEIDDPVVADGARRRSQGVPLILHRRTSKVARWSGDGAWNMLSSNMDSNLYNGKIAALEAECCSAYAFVRCEVCAFHQAPIPRVVLEFAARLLPLKRKCVGPRDRQRARSGLSISLDTAICDRGLL